MKPNIVCWLTVQIFAIFICSSRASPARWIKLVQRQGMDIIAMYVKHTFNICIVILYMSFLGLQSVRLGSKHNLCQPHNRKKKNAPSMIIMIKLMIPIIWKIGLSKVASNVSRYFSLFDCGGCNFLTLGSITLNFWKKLWLKTVRKN